MLPELFYNFMISKNMTGDISPDLESYTGENVKYTKQCLSHRMTWNLLTNSGIFH